MSVQIAKQKASNLNPICPKCGAGWQNIEFLPENIRWVPNGHLCRIGNNVVEAVDPEPIKGTCKMCETVIDFDKLKLEKKEREKEKVEFT